MLCRLEHENQCFDPVSANADQYTSGVLSVSLLGTAKFSRCWSHGTLLKNSIILKMNWVTPSFRSVFRVHILIPSCTFVTFLLVCVGRGWYWAVCCNLKASLWWSGEWVFCGCLFDFDPEHTPYASSACNGDFIEKQRFWAFQWHATCPLVLFEMPFPGVS